MDTEEVDRAVGAVKAVAETLGLSVDRVTIVQNSNKLSLRLLPCDVLARVARTGQEVAAFEIEVARRLAETGAPVAGPAAGVAPRVHHRAGFAITWWAYHRAVADPTGSPVDYARALERLHLGMRAVHVAAPHVLDRVEEAELLVADRDRTPSLDPGGRQILLATFESVRQQIGGGGAAEQLLHGEPHPGNVLDTSAGPAFIDLETCCIGPVEFDVAHAPVEVGGLYHGLDQDLLSACRRLVLAMVAAWRWDVDDEFPDGARHGRAVLDLLHRGPPWPALGDLRLG